MRRVYAAMRDSTAEIIVASTPFACSVVADGSPPRIGSRGEAEYMGACGEIKRIRRFARPHAFDASSQSRG